MKWVDKIKEERDEALHALLDVRKELEDLECYLLSTKFQGPDADYVHLRTDLLPKLREIRSHALR
jgi:hypothetical protein